MVLFDRDVCVAFYVSEQGSLNSDAVSSVILPFLSPAALSKTTMTTSTNIGVKEMRPYRGLIKDGLGHFGYGPRSGGSMGPHHSSMKSWKKATPMSYQATFRSLMFLFPVPSLGDLYLP